MKKWYDKEYILSKLPDNILQDIVDRALNGMRYYYVKDDPLEVWCVGDRGDDHVVERFVNKEELMVWVCKEICWDISIMWELVDRKEEEKKWRYVQDHAEDGKWFYREHKNYQYNAICDTRKFSFEKALKLLKTMIPEDEWKKQVERYTRLMNRWFKIPHWGFDETQYQFIEISDSKEYASDFDDTEEPREGSIVNVS